MFSLLENNKEMDRIRIFMIDDHISEENRVKMRECVSSYGRELVFVDGQELLDSPEAKRMQDYKGTRKNTHSFLKMLVIDRLPDDVSRILYLDSDTLVLERLNKLSDFQMNGCVIGMVMDSLVDKKKALIGFERNDPYYNSGVILVDVGRWKAERYRDKLIEHSMYHTYGTVDQDILNVVFKDRILTLPIEYNFQPHHLVYDEKTYFTVFTHKDGLYYSADEIRKARESIRIMHFFRYLGEQPWHKGNVHPCTPYFDRYLKKSPWNDYDKKESRKGALFRIEKGLYEVIPRGLFLRLFTFFFNIKLKVDIKAGK